VNSKITIVFTGGTISMKFDRETGGAVPQLSGEQILAQVSDLPPNIEIQSENFGLLPGPHMTPSRMLELTRRIAHILKDPTQLGVVVTHGTDTLEETAYLQDLLHASAKPVVFVGAMRNSSELSWDGPANLRAAIRVAAAPEARNLGALVVMNDQVLAAAEVTKTHTEAVDTFQSLSFGPLGFLDKDRLFITRTPKLREHVHATTLEERVEMIRVYAGFNGRLIDHAVSDGARGIVLEALGRGNVPPASVPAIERAIAQGMPVILTSRCPKGRVLDTYAYDGGGHQLTQRGAILGGMLPGPKARIKLMLLLGSGMNLQQIKAAFEESSGETR
jgi:L-asparaginase